MQLRGLGFNQDFATMAFDTFGQDVEQAAEFLTALDGDEAFGPRGSEDAVEEAPEGEEEEEEEEEDWDSAEWVIDTLVGDYLEVGWHAGRKSYRRREVIHVFLFYWNEHDGVELQGWWFGNGIGGSSAL